MQRARILLLAHEGVGTNRVARKVGCSERTVRKWKERFGGSPTLDTLDDLPRPGRPARVTVAVRCELVRLACDRPDGKAAPFRDLWTHRSLADALHARTGVRISASEVGRILRYEDLRPHRVRQWLKSSDPDFKRKADAICDLYLKPPGDAVVLCIDEKPLQVLERLHATHSDPRDASVRYEFEYKRRGTQSLLAAFEVGTGRVVGRVVPHRTGKALVSFMDHVARQYPERTVYVVWDNLNVHYDGKDERWTRFNERHGGRFHFVYTPKHASWLNQVEIWFSILQRRVLEHGDFKSPKQQKFRIQGFIKYWNRKERHPFRWTWRTDGVKNRGRRAKKRALRHGHAQR